MENNEKAFCSQIVTYENNYKNNLYDLLKIVPAVPLVSKDKRTYTCDFLPKTNKVYVPKKRSRVKVKTVRDIRSSFENDTYAYLTNDLKSQQSYLLKKIRDGCLKEENTKKTANKILRANAPISRAAWQMLININPENHDYPRQFVIWNAKLIQVNGSYGGTKKVIHSCDLGNAKLSTKLKKTAIKNNIVLKKKGLLLNSLAVKFKPGPLGRKKFLEDSHQEQHGDIELLELPKVGLEVQPMYGTVLEPTIMHFLSDLRSEDGTISKKWAEFAVSVLGKNSNSNVKLLNNKCMTFDLKYKCDQRRILMRKELDNSCYPPTVINTCASNKRITTNQLNVLPEINDIMNNILDAVDISVNQDRMFDTDEIQKENDVAELNTTDMSTCTKDKIKRKFCELDRLDVTVIQLPKNFEETTNQLCGNTYCSLGCICDSLKSTCKFKRHCGREECMFDCKCNFTKYTSLNSLEVDDTDLLPGIINIENEINTGLTKEEQKFHQTVIVTGEKNILFKSQKRNWKASKKYETFYKGMCLKSVDDKENRKRELSITLLKLNCENVEPWCMVHNLYKCFCKGKFTESSRPLQSVTEDRAVKESGIDGNSSVDKTDILTNTIGSTKRLMRRCVRQNTSNLDTSVKLIDTFNTYSGDILVAGSGSSYSYPEKRRKKENNYDIRHTRSQNEVLENSGRSPDRECENSCASESSDSINYNYSNYTGTCSRAIEYGGRKYSDEHYKCTNNKIKEMEKNDKSLQIRMSFLTVHPVKEGKSVENVEKTSSSTKLPVPERKLTKRTERKETSVLSDINDIIITSSDGNTGNTSLRSKKRLPGDNKLVDWLESNYKMYKKRIDQGLVKTSLEPPKVGKVALHSWEFILSRYRERKNLFLISKQMPYRIFMGVHTKNPFFSFCMNINEIRFADLHKYPQTVKHLLTNAVDLKDIFCILRGLEHCWELVGIVAKVNKNEENTECINDEMSDTDLAPPQSNYSDIPSSSDEQQSLSSTEQYDNQVVCTKDYSKLTELLYDSESSKWFVMTVENDFSEIRFYKKGFFVKYESIVKAINVARLSGKTVRLSSQKCVDKNNGPQFGVYAIPNTNEYCVFIGPYEMQDSLGIETIKSILDVRKSKRTRGFWMNTNKIDNLKVIDNPLSFMPLNSLQNNEAVPLDNHFREENSLKHQDISENFNEKERNEKNNSTLPKPEITKIVKPIKIRKTNGFYHLATDGVLKKISLQSPQKVVSMNAPMVSSGFTIAPKCISNRSLLRETVSENSLSEEEKSPQIKISAIYSQRDDSKTTSKKYEGGMSILKPEEINRKLVEGNLLNESTSPSQNEAIVRKDPATSSIIEYPLFRDDLGNSAFLAPCTLNTDVYVISDDEDDIVCEVSETDNCWKEVLIECTNVSDLGWIRGKQKSDSRLLSFQIPGGEYSEFYTEKDAFKNLNKALTALIAPSKPFDLEWRVVNSSNKDQENVTLMDCEKLHQVFKETSTSLSSILDACKSSPALDVTESEAKIEIASTAQEGSS